MPGPGPESESGAARAAGWGRVRAWAPEGVLAALAAAVFLGCLGSVDLWGKREQRASAEAIDTIDRGSWLVAQIQGRPRLEKPPLPRWTIASLMTLTGRRDEWMVRLPSALSALGLVGLVYALGTRLGGRQVGLASGFVLSSTALFINEMRQASNDGPLAFFTALALYAAWRRLHGDAVPADAPEPDDPHTPSHSPDADAAPPHGGRGWALLMYAALGLGFLCKGPIALVMVALTVVPYLACARDLRRGAPLLWDGWGVLLLLALAASWPVPVALSDPNAVRVWLLEMGQKAGRAGLAHQKPRTPLGAEWFAMTLPWAVVATTGALLPFLKRGAGLRPRVWFPWWWALGNLAMFSLWPVAKTNYYIPCLPAAALLAGLEWVRLTRAARLAGAEASRPRRVLQAHWAVLFAIGLAAPVALNPRLPGWIVWTSAGGLALAAAAAASAGLWRRGADGLTLAPFTAAVALAVAVGYGVIAPSYNDRNSHRALAAELDRILPADARRVMFFHELDEGLWFYLRGRTLTPVPDSQPEYNDAFRLAEEARQNRLELDLAKRVGAKKKILLDWLRRPADAHPSDYVLIRRLDYERFEGDLAGLVAPLHVEHDLDRNELVLFRILPPARRAAPDAAIAGPHAAEGDTRRE